MRRPGERVLSGLALAWGLAWWIGAGLFEIERFGSSEHAVALAVGWLALTTVLLLVIARALPFTMAARPAVGLVPALLLVALFDAAVMAARGGHLLAGLDALGWLAAVAAGVAALKVLERDDVMPRALLAAAHAALLWLALVLAAEESAWLVRAASTRESWRLASWLLVPSILTIALCRWRAPATWPFDRWRAVHVGVGAGVVVLVLVATALFANVVSDGDPAPLPYVPLLNPLDLTFAAIALAAVLWWREAGAAASTRLPETRVLAAAGAVAGVFWLTMSTVRTVHHFADVPFRADAIWQSGVVQAALAIVWTMTALAAMVLANRRDSRGAWIGGAVLLGAVVVKLFLVDLAQAGGVARIVSFIGVGLLLLVIGYLAPVPARRAGEAA